MRHIPLARAVLLLLFLTLLGGQVRAQGVDTRPWSALERFRLMAPWLGEQTLFVATVDLEALEDPLQALDDLRLIPWLPRGDLPGRIAAQAEHLGVDLSQVAWVGLVGTLDPKNSILWFGDYRGEIQGRPIGGEEPFAWATQEDGIFLHRIPDTRSLVAAWSRYPSPPPTAPPMPSTRPLARVAADRLFHRTFELLGDAPVAAAIDCQEAILILDVYTAIEYWDVLPWAVGVAADAEGLHLVLGGEPPALAAAQALATMIDARGPGWRSSFEAWRVSSQAYQNITGFLENLWPHVQGRLIPALVDDQWIRFDVVGAKLLPALLSGLGSLGRNFTSRIRREQMTIEALSVMDSFVKAINKRYQEGGLAAIPAPAGPVPAAGTCCGESRAGKCEGDEEAWEAAFGPLGVPYPGPHRYAYEIVPGAAGEDLVIIVRARGDLDCDGVLGTWERRLTRGTDREGRSILRNTAAWSKRGLE